MSEPAATATIYEMPATDRAPRSRAYELTDDEARYIDLRRKMLAKTPDEDGARISQLTERHIGDRIQLRVEKAY